MAGPHPKASSSLGSIAEVTVTSVGGLGDGLSQWQEKTLFIPKTCVGDRVRARIIHENHEGYTATLLEVLEAGPERVPAPCPHFAACGGCTLQQLNETAYRDFKTRTLHSAITRAGFDHAIAQMQFLAPGTRRRVEFKLHHLPEGLRLGFFEPRSRTPVPITECLILRPELQALLAPLTEALKRLSNLRNIRACALTLADSGIDLLLTLQDP
ncbi:MAG: hypothetical protein K2Q01_10705, partial [Rickettsiales bacterium]|nr:hypothetical protein [Rickettsiales bacterium]